MRPRTLDDVMASLSPERRARIEARAGELMREVDSLGISQPSVSKIERQTDLYLSTLRRFVEAAGGTLELRVEFPGKPPLRLTGLGDVRD
ncbi:MAG: hypothetical protein RLY86_888 [Pseudomonadota bacterium]|jgi:hypothetical protein